jgi:hypothetical protein
MSTTAEQLVELQQTTREQNQAIEAAKQRKLQCVNIAHVTLLENKRNLPVEQRQITPAEITAFADSLFAYANA